VVYQGILSSTVSCQHICDKAVGHFVFRVKHSNHFGFLDDEDSSGNNCSCSRRVYRLAPKTPYTKKISGSQNLHNRFLASRIDHGKSHTTVLTVNDILRGIALRVDGFFAFELGYFSSQTVRFEKQFHIEDSGAPTLGVEERITYASVPRGYEVCNIVASSTYIIALGVMLNEPTRTEIPFHTVTRNYEPKKLSTRC
jgi:hypothetical protein